MNFYLLCAVWMNQGLKSYLLGLLEGKSEEKLSRSMRFPKLMPVFVWGKRLQRQIANFFVPIARGKSDFFPYSHVRHQSPVMRKLEGVDMQLQQNKVKNLTLAVEKINGIVIQPGEVFSFWELVGEPRYEDGFLDGVLISRGEVTCGVGGGLCQLGNLLYWMFLHTELKIIERHRHSYDIFPDSGRVLPFASGATVFYNYVDLKVKNTTTKPMQIKLWIDEKYLKGQLLSLQKRAVVIHVYEENHCFIRYCKEWYRFNQIKRLISSSDFQREELVSENLAPVKYEITPEKIRALGYEWIDFDAEKMIS